MIRPRRAAEETGVEDFDYVSAHDLRRRYAQRLLVDNQMNPRVVMSVGGGTLSRPLSRI